MSMVALSGPQILDSQNGSSHIIHNDRSPIGSVRVDLIAAKVKPEGCDKTGSHLPELKVADPDCSIHQHGRQEDVEEQVCGGDAQPDGQGIAPLSRVDRESNRLAGTSCMQFRKDLLHYQKAYTGHRNACQHPVSYLLCLKSISGAPGEFAFIIIDLIARTIN